VTLPADPSTEPPGEDGADADGPSTEPGGEVGPDAAEPSADGQRSEARGGDGPDADPSADGQSTGAQREDRPGLERKVKRRGRLRSAAEREVGPALEIVALTAFVLARPIFGSFGRSPETFVARGADWTDVLAFALLVALVPPLVLVAGELAVGGISSRARGWARIGVMVVLSGLVVWQLVEQVADWDSGVGVPVSLVAGALITFAWRRVPSVSVFLRYASVGLVVFLVQFLVLAPTASIVLGHRHGGVDPAAAREVAAAVGDDAPPVVLVVMDGLPTELLLDGSGHIDADLYPNFASLADDSTWYRNNTTVAQFTLEAVPAILSGQTPDASDRPAVTGSYEHNLFTLLGDSYDLHVGEQITGLCPVSLCPEPGGSPLGGLSGDAYEVWRAQMADTALDPELVPQAFDDRYERAHDWIAAQDFQEGGKPDLFAYHLLLPHAGWQYLPDGSEYAASGPPEGMLYDVWGAEGTAVGRQRHVLQAQAADGLLGELLDRLKEAGTYDDSVVAVTADHGYAFTKDAPWRALDPANVDQIMWTPLIVKSPGQTEGRIDDRNTNTTDVLPTIGAEIGLDELPWPVDGEPAQTSDRDPADKWVVDWNLARLRPDHGEDVVHVDGVEGFAKVLRADPVEATGPDAVWRHTRYGRLVGTEVDEAELGEPEDTQIEVQGLDQWRDVDPDLPPLEVAGKSPITADEPVAIAVNGTVAAVVPATGTPYGVALVHALLWPDALRAGGNKLTAYRVEGPVEAPVLHPLKVVPRED